MNNDKDKITIKSPIRNITNISNPTSNSISITSNTSSNSPNKRRSSNANEENPNEIKDINNLDNKTIFQKMKIHSNTKFKITDNNNNSNYDIIKQSEKLNRKSSTDENNLDFFEFKCPKCNSIKDSYKKSISIIKNYVDCINERLNFLYHKINPQKKSNISGVPEMDYSISPEFYHTLYYSEIDKFKLNSEISFQLRSLMKSLRLFNDKYEYINKKHENFERVSQEYKNMKISNKTEDLKNIPEYDVDIKNMEVQKIFQNFNVAKEGFENTLKEIKSSLNNNDRGSVIVNKIILIFILNFILNIQIKFREKNKSLKLWKIIWTIKSRLLII
jgi:hypothetical protein